MDKIRVAVVGLGFGAEFVPIYQAWEYTECVAVCRRDEAQLNRFADQFGIAKRYTDYLDMLKDPEIDAVHINSDLKSHGWMTIEALKAGKHVASTVTMAMTAAECEEIVRLEQSTGNCTPGKRNRQSVYDDGNIHLYARISVLQKAIRGRRNWPFAVFAGIPPAKHVPPGLAELLVWNAANVVSDACRRSPVGYTGRVHHPGSLPRLWPYSRGIHQTIRIAVRRRKHAIKI